MSCVARRVVALAGGVAQLVEQRTENPRVAGSIPAATTPSPYRASLPRVLTALRSNWAEQLGPILFRGARLFLPQ